MSASPPRRAMYRGDPYDLTFNAGAHIWAVSEAGGGAPLGYVTRAARDGIDVHVVRRGFSPLHLAAIFVASAPGKPEGARVFSTTLDFEGEVFEVAIRGDGAWEFLRGSDAKKLGEVAPPSPGVVVGASSANDAARVRRLARFVGL